MSNQKNFQIKFLGSQKASKSNSLLAFSDKKAQGLSINTIILIVLGVIVLVALIFGFTKGWAGVSDWISPSNNVNKIATECRAACSTGATYDWCTTTREIKVDGQSKGKNSCKEWATTQYSTYGIENCTIECPQ